MVIPALDATTLVRLHLHRADVNVYRRVILCMDYCTNDCIGQLLHTNPALGYSVFIRVYTQHNITLAI